MRNILLTIAACLALITSPVFAHHAAEGIVDEEVYEMIDTMIADTPHAEMTIDDIAIGMTETTITTQTLKSLEVMIDDGLLTYIAMLDGEVTITIDIEDNNSVTLTVLQQE